MSERFKRVSVVGLGYIGLPTAAAFAARKVHVIGVDINENTVRTISQGRVHIVEPELDIVVHAAVSEGFLRATTTPEPADAFIIAVPTPFKEDHEPDLRYIESASRSIAPVLKKGNLIILESTSPVGATEQMTEWLAIARPDLTFPQQAGEDSDIRVAHCPERVLPGQVIRELVENDRVIGGMTAKCSEAATALYKIFVKGECIVTDVRTAEMCKLAENASRDVGIAFANELSMICDRLGINVWELIKLANRHPRVNILQPGPGVGGHCIAVDPWFILHKTPEEARLIRAARLVNDHKPHWVLEKVDAAVNEYHAKNAGATVRDIKIACFGLAFKPNIDDLRESPSLDITLKLAEKYPGQVIAVEPNVEIAPECLTERGIPFASFEDAVSAGTILVLLVDHDQFKKCAPSLFIDKVVIDTKGIWQLVERRKNVHE